MKNAFSKESPLAYWRFDNDDRSLETARLITTLAASIGTVLVYAGVSSFLSKAGEGMTNCINNIFYLSEAANMILLLGHGAILHRMTED